MLPEQLEGKEFQEYLTELVRKESKTRHVNYDKTVAHAEEMAVHAWGKKPTELLERARPREEAAVREYRLGVWEPITLSKCDKSISVIQKIFNPKLYSIEYPTQPGGIKLRENETLEEYLTKSYPEFDSILMFKREVLLKKMIADPNAILAIVPTKYDLPQNEFQKPIAVIFGSTQVLDYKKGVYYVLKDESTVKTGKREGSILHIFTVNSIVTYHETFDNNNQGKSKFIEFARFDHNFGIIPAWFLGGVVDSETWPYYFKSFFNAALPFWNKAIMRDSDLDGAYVNHLHPQKWEMTMDCTYSDGDGNMCQEGRVFYPSKQVHGVCPRCHGSSKVSVKSPYDVYQISSDVIAAAEGKTPSVPPAGYITVPVEIIGKLEERVEKDINAGLSAINMEIVNMIGANQSGIAKEYDRSELHSFMQQISDYIYDNHLPNIIYFINRYRYGVILGNKTDDYLPSISKPTNFDILTIKELTSEIAEAKTTGQNTAYITALQQDQISKRFSTNSVLKDQALAIVNLDPFPNTTYDDKTTMDLSGTVSKVDITISNNIIEFVRRAVEEENGFLELERAKQRDILVKYAQEILKGNETKVSDLVQPQLPPAQPTEPGRQLELANDTGAISQ